MDNSELERLKMEKLPPDFLEKLPPGGANFVVNRLRQDYERPSGQLFRGNREYRLCSLGSLLIATTILSAAQYEAYPHSILSSVDKWLYIIFTSGCLIASVLSYPPSARVTSEGIVWQRHFRRKFLPWNEIDFAGIGGNSELVVYGTNDRTLDFIYTMQGQRYLCGLIQAEIELHQMERKHKEALAALSGRADPS